MAAFVGGVGWVVSTPRLWLRAAVPMVTALVLVIALGVVGVREAMVVAHHAVGEGLGGSVLAVALGLAAIVLAIAIGVSLAQPLSGWALDGIVRAQERELGLARTAHPSFVAEAFGSLGSALLGLALGVPLIALLVLVAWVFPPAAVVTVPLKVGAGALWLAWDLIDYPFAARGVAMAARMKWCVLNFGALLGFGLAALALFAVPGLGLLALPCGVAGAVRLVATAPGHPKG
jgi:CysZ protein